MESDMQGSRYSDGDVVRGLWGKMGHTVDTKEAIVFAKVLPIVAKLPDEKGDRHGEVENHEKVLCVFSIHPCYSPALSNPHTSPLSCYVVLHSVRNPR